MLMPKLCQQRCAGAAQPDIMRVAPLRSASPTTSVEEGSDDGEASMAVAPSCSAAPASKARRGGYMVCCRLPY